MKLLLKLFSTRFSHLLSFNIVRSSSSLTFHLFFFQQRENLITSNLIFIFMVKVWKSGNVPCSSSLYLFNEKENDFSFIFLRFLLVLWEGGDDSVRGSCEFVEILIFANYCHQVKSFLRLFFFHYVKIETKEREVGKTYWINI